MNTLTQSYDVIIFKHCYPGADVLADTGDPDISSSRKSLVNYKLQYRALRGLMDSYADNQFIVWTLAPRHRLATNTENAQRAKEFVDWVNNEWLTEDGNSHDNIHIFDFWGHAAEEDSTPANGQVNTLRYEYERSHSGSDSHPNTLANETIGPIFAEFIVGAADLESGKSDGSDCSSENIRCVPDEYATLNAAAAAAQDGDTIEIQAGTYEGSGIVATLSQDNLTIRGIDGHAHLNADGVTISNGKAIFVTTGENITIENIEFSNAVVRDENGARIRHEGGLLTLRNCYFHDNEMGILTSQQDHGELFIENTEFDHNGLGRAGYTHNIYVGHITKFTMQYSYSHHTTHGHNVKSRAAENHILYNRIMDETSGNASYQIDIPNGGLTYIIGNTIHQGTSAENSSMISYAAEGLHADNPVQELYVSGNTLVNGRSGGRGIRLSHGPTAVIVNNIFDNIDPNQVVDGDATVFTGNMVRDENSFVDRSNHDSRLTVDSPARDAAGDPGSYIGIDLTPVYEYDHSTSNRARVDDGHLDVGAFEYSEGGVEEDDVDIDDPSTDDEDDDDSDDASETDSDTGDDGDGNGGGGGDSGCFLKSLRIRMPYCPGDAIVSRQWDFRRASDPALPRRLDSEALRLVPDSSYISLCSFKSCSSTNSESRPSFDRTRDTVCCLWMGTKDHLKPAEPNRCFYWVSKSL